MSSEKPPTSLTRRLVVTAAKLAVSGVLLALLFSRIDVAKLWETKLSQWRRQHPDEFRSYQKWVAGH